MLLQGHQRIQARSSHDSFRPSHLLPPTAAIAAQLNALQLNDWPEPAAGIHTAFMFTKPHQCEQLMVGPVRIQELAAAVAVDTNAKAPFTLPVSNVPLAAAGAQLPSTAVHSSSAPSVLALQAHVVHVNFCVTSCVITGPSLQRVSRYTKTQRFHSHVPVLCLQPLPDHARSWRGKEEWLCLSDFTDMLWSDDYRPLINCDSWQVQGTTHCMPTATATATAMLHYTHTQSVYTKFYLQDSQTPVVYLTSCLETNNCFAHRQHLLWCFPASVSAPGLYRQLKS